MKKIFLKIVIGVVLACILFVCFLYTNNEIGVTSSKLEADIRSSQKIKDDWTVDGSVSSTMAAYISYPQDLSDHSFSVYVNRPGLSFGYFFRGGGKLSGVQRGIAEYTVEGYNERAFISMNQQQVTQLEIDDGNTIQVLDIDSNKPFAIPAFTGSYADWAQTLIYLCEMTFTIAMTVGSVKGAQTLISIYDGKDFAIEFNHFRSIKGCFDKDSNIEIMENTLNEKENILYTENNEIIEDVLKQLLEIHNNVYRR